MEKEEKWLLNLVKKFRRILYKEEYSEYKEFFRAFSGDVTYVSLQLVGYYYANDLDSYELRIYKNFYGDNVEVKREITLKSTLNISNRDEKARIEWENDAIKHHSYMEPTDINEAGNVIDWDFLYPLEIISLPKYFLKLNVVDFVKQIIDKEILWRLKNFKDGILPKKSLNRLSLIDNKTLEEIIEFLEADWTTLTDDKKIPFFDKIFYYLGFETIPLEKIRNYKKFNFLNRTAHPEIIAYDLNSNFILLVEELKKLEKKYLYKKDVINTIIEKFHSFLPYINRNINFIIIVNQPVTIDLEDYKFKHRIIEKEEFTGELLNVFKLDLLTTNFDDSWENSSKVEKCINFIKSTS